MSPVPSPQENRVTPPRHVPLATGPRCPVPSTHGSRDLSPAPRAIGCTSCPRCPLLPREQGCPEMCFWGCPTCPFKLREQGHIPSDKWHWGHVPCAPSHHPAGSGMFLPRAARATSLLGCRAGSCFQATCHHDTACRVVPSHGTCPPAVRGPDGRGCPARRGPSCGQAGGQRVPAPAPGPHLRPGGSAGVGR